MQIILNGKKNRIASGTTLQTLLTEKGLTPEQVVVELNADIIERQAYGQTEIAEGDSVEILQFVGGG